jgi:hypothetical protein
MQWGDMGIKMVWYEIDNWTAGPWRDKFEKIQIVKKINFPIQNDDWGGFMVLLSWYNRDLNLAYKIIGWIWHKIRSKKNEMWIWCGYNARLLNN